MMEFISVYRQKGLQIISFNRPEKKNALTSDMFINVPKLLQDAAKDSEVNILAFTGKGEYFTSGNDLSNFMKVHDSKDSETERDMKSSMLYARNVVYNFVAAFIDFPKPLVAVVNGPSIGIGVTILGLFDYVFASDLATFHCPFTNLGQTPEGCSSFTFPILMGHSKAAEVLIFGKKISATEAQKRNLVTEVIPHKDLSIVWKRIYEMAALPKNTIANAKAVMRTKLLPLLHRANKDECDALMEQWISEEFMDSVLNFIAKKSKL